MICPQCQTENSSGAKFCKGCGGAFDKATLGNKSILEDKVVLTQSKKPIKLIIGVAVLIVMGSVGGVIYFKNKDTQAPVVAPLVPQEISTQIRVESSVKETPTVPEESSVPMEKSSKSEELVNSDTKALFSSSVDINDEEYLALKSMSPAFANADKSLNQAFSKVRKELSDSERERLKHDQRIWIKQRNQQAYNMGAKGSKAYIESLVEQSNQREQELLKSF